MNKIIYSYIFIIIFILLVPLAYIYNFFDYPISKDSSSWGTFGDYIGGILNPIFSFLSFILLLINLKTQIIINKKNDLRNEKEETERSISYISPILSEIHKRIKPQLKNYPAKNAPKAESNPRINGSYSVYWDIRDDLILLYNFLLRIERLQIDSPFLEYYRLQYKEVIKLLCFNNYLDYEIQDFFNK